MEDNFNIEEIEQYLEGSLQGTALKEFEARLLKDKTLACRVELLKQVDISIQDEKAIELQKTVVDLGNDFFKKESTTATKTSIRRIPFYRRPLAIAASFLAILAFGFMIWWQMNPSSVSNQKLYAAYYTPYQANNVQRGESPEENLFNQAVQQYQSKDYDSAIASFREYLSSNPSDMQALYVLSHAYLNTTPPNLELAKTPFLTIIRDGKSIQLSKAQWYLALIFLKEEKIDQTKKLLTDLVLSQDDKMAEQAKDLLKKINAR